MGRVGEKIGKKFDWLCFLNGSVNHVSVSSKPLGSDVAASKDNNSYLPIEKDVTGAACYYDQCLTKMYQWLIVL